LNDGKSQSPGDITDGRLWLVGAGSIALGGMVGGGIFAVLGADLLYFERETLLEGALAVEERL
jgi:hypothetical protein